MISTVPLSERPRERCLEKGPSSLSLRECLAILLGSGPPQTGALGISGAILVRAGEGFTSDEGERAFFTAMESTGQGHLSNIPGLGPAGQARILAAFEIARRYANYRSEQAPPAGADPVVQALARISPALRAATQEWLGFVPIHRSGKLGEFCLVEKGVRTHVNTDPVEFFARLLALRPKGFFLFHNHPSGDTTPSNHDRALTREMDRLSNEFGIRLLGHWIVTCRSEQLLSGYH